MVGMGTAQVRSGTGVVRAVQYDPDTQELLDLAAATLEDTKAQDLVVLDVRAAAGNLFDALLICTVTSSRHGVAMSDRLRLALKQADHDLLGYEGPGEVGWTLLDAGSVVIHIMSVAARAHYDLEGLWDSWEEA